MFRRWLSGLFRNNKWKLGLIIKVLAFGAIIVLAFVYIIFDSSGENESNNEEKVYNPKQTVMYGKAVKEEEYETDSNIIDTFISYCNEGKTKEAYNLLTEECKEKVYPKLSDFTEKYYNKYFNQKKEYSLQSWMNKSGYNTYKIRIIDDVLATGQYDNIDKYEDYITIIENNNEQKLNINGFIREKNINEITESSEFSIKVKTVEIYMNYEEYTIEITNNTDKKFLLDSMELPKATIRIEDDNGATYSVIPSSINYIVMKIEEGKTEQLKIQFNKSYTSNSNSQVIHFSKVVKDYTGFMKDKEKYKDMTEIRVKV